MGLKDYSKNFIYIYDFCLDTETGVVYFSKTLTPRYNSDGSLYTLSREEINEEIRKNENKYANFKTNRTDI